MHVLCLHSLTTVNKPSTKKKIFLGFSASYLPFIRLKECAKKTGKRRWRREGGEEDDEKKGKKHKLDLKNKKAHPHPDAVSRWRFYSCTLIFRLKQLSFDAKHKYHAQSTLYWTGLHWAELDGSQLGHHSSQWFSSRVLSPQSTLTVHLFILWWLILPLFRMAISRYFWTLASCHYCHCCYCCCYYYYWCSSSFSLINHIYYLFPVRWLYAVCGTCRVEPFLRTFFSLSFVRSLLVSHLCAFHFISHSFFLRLLSGEHVKNV